MSFGYSYRIDAKIEEKVYIVSTADPIEVFELFLSEFVRAETIKDCEQIQNGRIVKGKEPPPPWWYIIAKKLLDRLYQSKNLNHDRTKIINIILEYRIVNKNGSHCSITAVDKRKIVDAMIWIHQNEDLPNKKTTVEPALAFIRQQIFLATELSN